MSTSIVTVAQAEAMAAKAAMRLGVSVSVWSDADAVTQLAAVEAASEDLYATPGAQIGGREGDTTVHLATVVQALYLLDLQGDAAAQERRRLQDQGVTGIQQGRTREQYRAGRGCGLCSAARQLLKAYGGAVYLA